MKRKAYPKFIQIKDTIFNVSTIKRIQKSNYTDSWKHYIEIVYFNGCETRTLTIYFDEKKDKEEAFNKVMEALL